MNDVRAAENLEESQMERIIPLASDVRRSRQNPDPQSANLLVTILITKRHQSCGNVRRHVPGQFQGIPLRAADRVARTKQGRNDMDDFHSCLRDAGHGHTST